MSKAILIMDMPESCDKCPLFHGYYSDMTCGALHKTIDYPYPKDFKQNWCPLRYAPSKQYHSIYGCGKVETSEDRIWNICIDTILGT